MLRQLLVSLAITLTVYATSVPNAGKSSIRRCKCDPTDSCWPTPDQWTAFNTSVSGKLIHNAPPAIVCYPGPQYNAAACNILSPELKNSSWVADNPIALDYPLSDGCPIPVNGQPAGNCSLGGAPVYTVNATDPQDVAAAVDFAREHNIRLAVRNTGHDLLGRSTGYGSLEVWIRYLRQGITFQDHYSASDNCSSSWKGSAFVIGGGYAWRDVYAEAEKENVIVVGGGDPSVGCIGGWAQGGGHSPASRDFGLGADQILEAEVVLADGRIVTANSCQNSDLYTAIRGGGGGTYGVVVSAIMKAHPQTSSVVAQILSLAPRSDAHIPEFMTALAELYSAYPDLDDAGYSGYGSWEIQYNAPVVGNSTTGYNHVFALFGNTSAVAEAAFAPTRARLEQFNSSILLNVNYQTFTTYQKYYHALSGGQGPVGYAAAVGSHLFGRDALSNTSSVLKMLNTIAGSPGELTSNSVCLVSGGQVHADASDHLSGVNPDWRTAYLHHIVGRAPGGDAEAQKAVHNDITYNKVGAMKRLAPNQGAYMNEADRNDPDFLRDFYGGNLEKLETLKRKYDPLGVFYCKTCVGSEDWAEDRVGRLCSK